ncbi:MAG: NCS1 family nucleobase:cation symporter-1 [Pseudomonadota bacterium]
MAAEQHSRIDAQPSADPKLFNEDLAPVPPKDQTWGWFELFNVWANFSQSLFAYTLAGTLFLSYGLNGWTVFAAIVLAGFIVMFLLNLSGRPGVKYGIPYPVLARAHMGVFGANFPAVIRAIVAVFWYGAQTYVASAAVALLIRSLVGSGPDWHFLGLEAFDWLALVIVSAAQIALFWRGIEGIKAFLNWAAPAVYSVMIALLVILWLRAGSDLLTETGAIIEGQGTYPGGNFAAFVAIVGTMIAAYAPVILNYCDFSRYVRSERDMRIGNFLGLPLNLAFFSLIVLLTTGGVAVVFGERLTNPTQIIGRVDNLTLTIIATLTFFVATIGINVVANFVAPANDLSNLLPSRISFRIGGLIAASLAFIVSALWVSAIAEFGIAKFVNSLAALLAPAYGILIADYYLVRKQRLDIEAMFLSNPEAAYFYTKGWNRRALAAFVVSAVFSLLAIWVPALASLQGFGWLIGVFFGGLIYWLLAERRPAGHVQ